MKMEMRTLKLKVHFDTGKTLLTRRPGTLTACSRYLRDSTGGFRRKTRNWTEVTCKDCLKRRPKMKGGSYEHTHRNAADMDR